MPPLNAVSSGILAALLLLGGGVGATPGNPSRDAGSWRSDPVRWLMEPAELRSWRNLQAAEDSENFLLDFWDRRDPDPEAQGNASLDLFEQRSAQADALFDGEGQRGILTSRGRAYLLIGPPSSFRQSYRRAPALGAVEAGRGRSATTGPMLVETWSWRPEDLSAGLRRHLEKQGWKLSLEVRFKVDHGRYTLLQGEDLLRLAARSWVRDER